MGAEDWGGGVKCYLPRVMTPVEVQATGIEPEHSSPNFVWAVRSAQTICHTDFYPCGRVPHACNLYCAIAQRF